MTLRVIICQQIASDEFKLNLWFTDRQRLFTDLLRIQLLLKGIINEEDWFDIKDNIDYIWTRDSHFSELKNNEILRERFEILAGMEEYIGKYISQEWVRKTILHLTDDEIKEMQKQIDKEKEEEPSDEDDIDVEDF